MEIRLYPGRIPILTELEVIPSISVIVLDIDGEYFYERKQVSKLLGIREDTIIYHCGKNPRYIRSVSRHLLSTMKRLQLLSPQVNQKSYVTREGLRYLLHVVRNDRTYTIRRALLDLTTDK